MATVAAAAAVTLGLAGCGSDDSSDTAATSTSAVASSAAASSTAAASSSQAGAAAAAAPTPAELQATLDKLADPATPTAEKTALIVDGEQRAAAIDQLTQALAGYGKLTFQVSDVTVAGTTATGQTVINSPNGAAPATPLTWENVDGSWKLSDATACTLLGFAMIPCT
ncbi:hypothetical protein [Nocardia sp. NPDC057353]|uniref:hypothetical protein n=1 Tax=Nocardia sp. NPDC057353 TaxID=3346104 RepID=UPI003625B41B